MKTNEIFNISRFGMLMRHNLIENKKMIAISVGGFCGGVFMLLLIIQALNNFQPMHYDVFFGTFMFLFIALGVILAGTSFPGFRTKEKSFGYLMLPASTTEKFVFELLTRILLFIILMPILYVIIFILENYFAALVYPEYYFHAASFFDGGIFNFHIPSANDWAITLVGSLILMVYLFPFTGTTIFRKYPLPKTLFALAVIFFFHVFLIFLYAEIMDVKSHAGKQMSVLGISDDASAIRFFAIYSIIINLALVAASYLKLKEKEV